jgi:hypothetical protein
MAGKQFTFFLGPSDQLDFEEAARASGGVVFLKELSNSPHPEEVATSRVLAMGTENLGLWIARREDLSQIEFRPIAGRGVFSCDPLSHPIIEFSRCYVSERFIRAGRLYRMDKYWDENGQLLTKSDAFVEWADRLYKLTKTSLTKIEQGCYAGAEALELRKKGIAFEGLDVAVGSLSK